MFHASGTSCIFRWGGNWVSISHCNCIFGYALAWGPRKDAAFSFSWKEKLRATFFTRKIWIHELEALWIVKPLKILQLVFVGGRGGCGPQICIIYGILNEFWQKHRIFLKTMELFLGPTKIITIFLSREKYSMIFFLIRWILYCFDIFWIKSTYFVILSFEIINLNDSDEKKRNKGSKIVNVESSPKTDKFCWTEIRNWKLSME